MRNFFQKTWNWVRDEVSTLKFRWTLMTAGIIFFCLTFFMAVAYQVTTQIMSNKELKLATYIIDETEKRLSNSHTELTKEKVLKLIGDSSYIDSEFNRYSDSQFQGNLVLSEVNLSVYNTEKVLLDSNKKETIPFIEPSFHTVPMLWKYKDVSGFQLTKRIYSKSNNELVGYVQIFYELDEYTQLVNDLKKSMIALEFVAVVISIVIGYILCSYFLRPLDRIFDTVSIVRNDPMSKERLPEMKRFDEFSDLAVVINSMLDRMQMVINQQQDFVADVSHEFRTPLSVLEGNINLLLRWGKDDPEILVETLESSLQETARLKLLIGEMLALSRMEQIDGGVSIKETPARKTVVQTLNNFRMLNPNYIFTLNDFLEEDEMIVVSSNHFEQLLIIILENAVKYSTDNKNIIISVFKDDSTSKMLGVSIEDSGEGISQEDIDKIFMRFYRVDRARSREKGGNGLGLAIANKIVEKYNGKINVSSQLDKGTIFTIFFPIKTKKTID